MAKGATDRSPRRAKRRGPTPRRRVEAKETADRYTAPRPSKYLFRPTWHKVVGVVLLVGGFVLFFACTFNAGNIHHYGGHIWYLVGVVVAASSSWWFGLFDRSP